MANHLFDIVQIHAQMREKGSAAIRLPAMEQLLVDFTGDGLDLNRALNRMQTCLVTLAMKRRQLFWEDVDVWLFEGEQRRCYYSPVIRTAILKGSPSLSIVWNHLYFRKGVNLYDARRRNVYSRPVRPGRVTRYCKGDFPKAAPELWEIIKSAEHDFARIRALAEKTKALRKTYGTLITEFNGVKREIGLDDAAVRPMEMKPVSDDDGPWS